MIIECDLVYNYILGSDLEAVSSLFYLKIKFNDLDCHVVLIEIYIISSRVCFLALLVK